MRISDWSSDVCSSDLIAKSDAGYGLETELAEPDAALIDAAAGAAQALDALYRPLVTLGRRLDAVLGEAPDWMDGPARARIEGAIASLGRSEEHTSELQSLMRISYAVFCLKKKNKKRKKHT